MVFSKKRRGAAGQKSLNNWNVSDDVTEMKCMFFDAKTSISIWCCLSSSGASSLNSSEASPKLLSDWTPHETVADLRRVAEQIVALAVVGADEAKTLVVPGDADARLARAALAAELASLGRAAGVARARAAGAPRRGARARAGLVAPRRAAVGHLCLLCAAG